MSEDIRQVIFTPAERSSIGVAHVQKIESGRHRAMPLPLEQIGFGQYFADLLPGQICAIQAQSSNYKTGFMRFWEEYLARHLVEHGRDDEVIIRVDTENSVEELTLDDLARFSGQNPAQLARGQVESWNRVIQAAGDIAGVEVYQIAASLGVEDAPELYLSNVYRAIKLMRDGKLQERPLRPACIFVDYLQALPFDPEVKQHQNLAEQRRLQVRRDVYRLKEMARHFDCPIVVGVQAKQHLNGHGGPTMMIPGLYDGEETSSIAQRFSRMISLWMPKMTHTVGDWLQHGQVGFEVTEDLLWVKVNKQQGRLPSGRSWRCRVDFDNNRIYTE